MKNNKKGFTLVELLAVIAILAILVIIALPNVLNMFEQARKNSFLNEVKEIYRVAQSQYVLDSTNATSAGAIVYASAGGDKTLQLDGGNNISYCIKVTGTGTVQKMQVNNGIYSYTNTSGSITNMSNITVDSSLTAFAVSNCN